MPGNALDTWCTTKTLGAEGYMYDAFTRGLIGEYLECDKDRIPIRYDGTDFHFEKDWYDIAHKVTLSCMEEQMSKIFWATDFGKFNTDLDIGKKLEVCANVS